HSDNTAANLLLRELGGPASLTAYLRRLGDAVTRVDRYEPALSEARPGDPRDTTTPAAMTELLRDLTARRVLSDASTGRLVGWMRAATTGLTRIRAGIARGWDVADKTGTTGSGRADIAIVSPPSGAQLLIAVYLAECAAADATQDAALAAAARLAVHALRG
ncbi:MAG: serine hydrolase, partial [Candidatus Eremiobacteraeota bacterium]|nr:serine hydrolase [Candidatus Eremiobacteraeota bacterium]